MESRFHQGKELFGTHFLLRLLRGPKLFLAKKPLEYANLPSTTLAKTSLSPPPLREVTPALPANGLQKERARERGASSSTFWRTGWRREVI